MPHDDNKDDVPNASSITGSACSHGVVTLELRDASGKPIARAFMGITQYIALTNDILNDLPRYRSISEDDTDGATSEKLKH